MPDKPSAPTHHDSAQTPALTRIRITVSVRACDIAPDDVIALPEEVYLPHRDDPGKGWAWTACRATAMTHPHRWRWVYETGDIDSEPRYAASLPLGFTLLRLSNDRPGQGTQHDDIVLALRELDLIDIQFPTGPAPVPPPADPQHPGNVPTT